MESWARGYIGIPFRVGGRDRSGCDCWGLVRLVYSEQFGKKLPALSEEYASLKDRAVISLLVDTTKPLVGAVMCDEPSPGAIVVVHILGRPFHVGVMVSPREMLHAWEGRSTCIERIDSPVWKKRIEGFYRVD